MASSSATQSQIPGAESFRLPGLVNYQQGSVVSRVLLKREKGNVTLFAFDRGQGLSEHTTPFDALAQAVEGEAEITVAGKPVALKARRNSPPAGAAAPRSQGRDALQNAPDHDSILNSLAFMFGVTSNSWQFCRIAACQNPHMDRRLLKSPSFPA
jgi:hypothetical protein